MAASFLFCQFQLVLYQFKVISPLTDQLGVRALLNDLSPAQDNDVVGMTYGREAVSNHDARAVVELLLQCLCDAPFVLGIKRGRGFVEQEVLRILVDGAGYHDALFLAAAHPDAFTAYLGVKSQRLFAEIAIQTGHADGFLQPCLVFGFPQTDVAQDGVGEEEVVLHHDAACLADRLGGADL